LSSQFVSRPQKHILQPQMGVVTHSLRSPVLVDHINYMWAIVYCAFHYDKSAQT